MNVCFFTIEKTIWPLMQEFSSINFWVVSMYYVPNEEE